MRVKDIAIGAGATVTLPGGVFFTIISCPDPVDLEFLRNGSSIDADASQVGAGYEMVDQLFSEVKVTSATAQTLKYGYSKSGKGRYGQAAVSIAGDVDVNVMPATGKALSEIAVDTTSGQLAANTGRRRALIYSMKANTVDVLIGTSGNRVEIEPGQSYVWENTAALDFRTASGTATLAVIEET